VREKTKQTLTLTNTLPIVPASRKKEGKAETAASRIPLLLQKRNKNQLHKNIA